ncbi:MAG TPA: hypothetical protein VF011_22195 [Terriglobales bacterium]
MTRSVPLFFALVAFAVLAQPATEVAITAEPHHHLALKNNYVRVFKVEVPPHQATLVHRHQYDYAYVTIGPVELSNDVEGKAPATLKLQDGETRFSPGKFSHAVRVLSDTPFRNLTIELLKNTGKDRPVGGWTDQRGLQILSGGTQDILFVKDGVRASDVQLNPGGTLPKDRHGTPQLIVAVSKCTLQTVPGTKASMPLQAGDFRWMQVAHGLINSSKYPARFISFDFR